MFRAPLLWLEMKASQEWCRTTNLANNECLKAYIYIYIYIYIADIRYNTGGINICLAPPVVHKIQYIHYCGGAGLPVDGTHP